MGGMKDIAGSGLVGLAPMAMAGGKMDRALAGPALAAASPPTNDDTTSGTEDRAARRRQLGLGFVAPASSILTG